MFNLERFLEWEDCLFTWRSEIGTACTLLPIFLVKDSKGGLERLQKNFPSAGSSRQEEDKVKGLDKRGSVKCLRCSVLTSVPGPAHHSIWGSSWKLKVPLSSSLWCSQSDYISGSVGGVMLCEASWGHWVAVCRGHNPHCVGVGHLQCKRRLLQLKQRELSCKRRINTHAYIRTNHTAAIVFEAITKSYRWLRWKSACETHSDHKHSCTRNKGLLPLAGSQCRVPSCDFIVSAMKTLCAKSLKASSFRHVESFTDWGKR